MTNERIEHCDQCGAKGRITTTWEIDGVINAQWRCEARHIWHTVSKLEGLTYKHARATHNKGLVFYAPGINA